MKKLLVLLFAVVLTMSCFVAAGAEGAINANEQAVLDLLDSKVTVGETTYEIPDEYVNQAKNYFLTIDMTEAESKDIIAALNKGIAALKATKLPTKEFDMKVLPQEVKETVLAAGKEACAVIDLVLVYNTSTQKVVITKGATTVFDSAPIVKTTGFEMNVAAVVVTMSTLAVVAVATVLVSKKAKLF